MRDLCLFQILSCFLISSSNLAQRVKNISHHCLLQADRLCAMDDFKELLPWLDGKARGSHLESTPPPSLAQNMRSILDAYQVWRRGTRQAVCRRCGTAKAVCVVSRSGNQEAA